MSRAPHHITESNAGNSEWVRKMIAGGLHAVRAEHWWCKRIAYSDLSLPAATGAQFNLNTLFPNDPFPANVCRGLALIGVHTPWAGAGIASITAALGYNGGDADALIDESTVSGGVARWLTTPGAVDVVLPYGNYEAAMVPALRLDAAGGPNLDAINAGVLYVAVPYSRPPGVFQVA